MFDGIAQHYDKLNRILSLGHDVRWRRELVAALDVPNRARILDVATGTADVALAVGERFPHAEITGVDPSSQMLAIGQQKVTASYLAGNITLKQGNSPGLGFDEQTFDAITVAFGIRNIPERTRALAEFHAILKKGGTLAVLELCEPRKGLLHRVAKLHVRHVVPAVGGWLSRSRDYRYLQQSIAAFPSPREFAAELESAGFEDVKSRTFTLGSCALFVATKGGSGPSGALS